MQARWYIVIRGYQRGIFNTNYENFKILIEGYKGAIHFNANTLFDARKIWNQYYPNNEPPILRTYDIINPHNNNNNNDNNIQNNDDNNDNNIQNNNNNIINNNETNNITIHTNNNNNLNNNNMYTNDNNNEINNISNDINNINLNSNREMNIKLTNINKPHIDKIPIDATDHIYDRIHTLELKMNEIIDFINKK